MLMFISTLLIKLRVNFRDVNYRYFPQNLRHTPDILGTAKE